jgi:hypothetical protein
MDNQGWWLVWKVKLLHAGLNCFYFQTCFWLILAMLRSLLGIGHPIGSADVLSVSYEE